MCTQNDVQNGRLHVVGAVHAVGDGVGAPAGHHPDGKFWGWQHGVGVGLVVDARVHARPGHQTVDDLGEGAVAADASDAVVRINQVGHRHQKVERVVGRLGRHHRVRHPGHLQQRLHLRPVYVQPSLLAAERVHEHEQFFRSSYRT